MKDHTGRTTGVEKETSEWKQYLEGRKVKDHSDGLLGAGENAKSDRRHTQAVRNVKMLTPIRIEITGNVCLNCPLKTMMSLSPSCLRTSCPKKCASCLHLKASCPRKLSENLQSLFLREKLR